MEQIADFQNWMKNLGTIYIVAILVGTIAFAFVAVCVGVAILRISKQNGQGLNVNLQARFRHEHDHLQSADTSAHARHGDQTQPSNAAGAEKPAPKPVDQKYWPPSAK